VVVDEPVPLPVLELDPVDPVPVVPVVPLVPVVPVVPDVLPVLVVPVLEPVDDGVVVVPVPVSVLPRVVSRLHPDVPRPRASIATAIVPVSFS
jgi:hypothetical protein